MGRSAAVAAARGPVVSKWVAKNRPHVAPSSKNIPPRFLHEESFLKPAATNGLRPLETRNGFRALQRNVLYHFAWRLVFATPHIQPDNRVPARSSPVRDAGRQGCLFDATATKVSTFSRPATSFEPGPARAIAARQAPAAMAQEGVLEIQGPNFEATGLDAVFSLKNMIFAF